MNSNSEKKEEIKGAEILLVLPEKEGHKEVVLRGLLDNGTSESIIDQNKVKNRVKTEEKTKVNWNTKGGNFDTFAKGEIQGLQLPQFTTRRSFNAKFHLFRGSKKERYDVIIGRDILQSLGIDIINSKRTFKWDDIEIPMMPMGYWKRSRINTYLNRIKNKPPRSHENFQAVMLPANYKKPDLKEVVSEIEHLNENQKETLLRVLIDNEQAFQGTKGKWVGEDIDIEIKPNPKPYFARPYNIPKSQEKLMRDEIARLEKIEVLSPVLESEWAAPSFGTPKKDQTIRLVSDFRVLNTMVVRKPFPLPRIQNILHSLGRFQWATVIDLSMGYWAMRLNERSRKICTIIFPWGLYQYNYIPMGLLSATFIFQGRMMQLFSDMPMVIKAE